jgi:hypothetical protein
LGDRLKAVLETRSQIGHPPQMIARLQIDKDAKHRPLLPNMAWPLLGIVLALPILAGCMSGGYRSLAGNYYLSDTDHSHVYILKKSRDQLSIVIDQQIVDFKIVENQLLVRRKVAESFDCYDKKNVASIITHYSNEDEYWVIDLKKDKETGPLKEESYFRLLKDLELPPVKLTVPSSFAPNSEAFKKWREECKKLVRA